MPCNTITTVQVKLKAEIVRIDWFVETLKQLGHTHIQVTSERVIWRTGVWERTNGMLTERSKERADEVVKSYATTLTKRTLGRAGWQVKTVEQGGR